MCVVSAIGDDFGRRWPSPASPCIYPDQNPWEKKEDKYNPFQQLLNNISKEEFDKLKKEVQDLRTILEQAKKFDDNNNEPNCHMDEKVALIKHFSKVFNINFDGIFDNEKPLANEAPEFEPHIVVGAEGQVGKFADIELAKKFANYLANYNNTEYTVISVVEDSHLKFAVVREGYLVAKFFDALDANNFIQADMRWCQDNHEDTGVYQVIELP